VAKTAEAPARLTNQWCRGPREFLLSSPYARCEGEVNVCELLLIWQRGLLRVSTPRHCRCNNRITWFLIRNNTNHHDDVCCRYSMPGFSLERKVPVVCTGNASRDVQK
jgi:hypothetical protein